MSFSKEQFDNAIKYCKNTNINGKSLYEVLKYFDIPISWFYTSVLDGTGKINYNVRKAKFFKKNDNITNNDFVNDMKKIIETDDDDDVSMFIVDLIQSIQ